MVRAREIWHGHAPSISVSRWITRLFSRAWVFPIVLLLIGIVAYGLQVAWLGFYWDDWQAVYLQHAASPQLIWEYFSYDRPFSAWTFLASFPILQANPVAWQVATLLIRYFALLCLYGVFRIVWPDYHWQAAWISALLMVYPGFLLQPISAAFSQHFTTFLFFTLSLLLMVLGIHDRKRFWIWMPLSVVSSLISVFTMEYFLGLETLRPLLLWFLLHKPGEHFWSTARRMAVIWLPFLAVLSLFVVWRVFVYPSSVVHATRNTPELLYRFLQSPLSMLVAFFGMAFSDIKFMLIQFWAGLLAPDSSMISRSLLIAYGASVLGAVVLALLTWFQNREDEQVTGWAFQRQVALAGIAALVFGSLPVWATMRQIGEGKWSGRFMLAPMLGVILLLVVLVDWLFRKHQQKVFFLAVLLAFSTATQAHNVNTYRLDWNIQKDFFWQLAWRAPALKAGTAILSATIPSDKQADYGTAYALNRVYSNEALTNQAPYWFFTPRSVGSSFAAMAPGLPITNNIRGIQFAGSTSNAIAVSYQRTGQCLRLLDPIYDGDPVLRDVDVPLLDLTNPTQVSTAALPGTPDPQIFSPEPAHTWCYYFQKADLARQMGNWSQVIEIMQDANLKDLKPNDGGEWLPLLEAYARTEQWQLALDTSQQALEVTPKAQGLICSRWREYFALPKINQNVIKEAGTRLGCD